MKTILVYFELQQPNMFENYVVRRQELDCEAANLLFPFIPIHYSTTSKMLSATQQLYLRHCPPSLSLLRDLMIPF